MRAFLVAGLAFGDEGKGSMVDFLVRHYGAKLVVRYNGGPQAAHNVVTPDGQHHTFSQFGSGSFVPECRTLLYKTMLVDPYAMLNEAEVWAKNHPELPGLLGRITVDPGCVVITPWHAMANRIKEEALGTARHGSCGLGIGESRSDQENGLWFQVSDIFSDAGTSTRLLAAIKGKKIEEMRELSNETDYGRKMLRRMKDVDPHELLFFYREKWAPRIQLANVMDFLRGSWHETVVFEGSQGVLIDQDLGFFPYVTWTDCTFGNLRILLACIARYAELEVVKIGVTRAYFVRHGPGPFITETSSHGYPERYNANGPWQGPVRKGDIDFVALRYALKAIGGVDRLALTHMDSINKYGTQYCDGYRAEHMGSLIKDIAGVQLTMLDQFQPHLKSTVNMVETAEEQLGVRVGYTSWGPTANDKLVAKSVEEEILSVPVGTNSHEKSRV